MRKAKVEDHKNLVRDLSTTAIVNTDTIAYERYVRDRDSRLDTKNELDRLRSEIDELKALLLNK
jgi:hypothetical protein|tara:strand:+ start:4627 stop:4818 length:192 start_codon:yes stop_codon:yes gene_type:complete